MFTQINKQTNTRRTHLISISSTLYALSSSFDMGEFINFTNPFRSTKRLAALVGFEFSSVNISSAVSCFFGTNASFLLWPKTIKNENEFQQIVNVEMEKNHHIN